MIYIKIIKNYVYLITCRGEILKYETRKCNYCGKSGRGKLYKKLRSDEKIWICPRCSRTEHINLYN